MLTMLVKDILQNARLCAADCNLIYMNKTLFNLIAFTYLIVTFKVKVSKKYQIFLENLFF